MSVVDQIRVPQRSREASAFLDTLQSVPGNAVTACRGWTVHEILAHLTAGAVALSDQAEAYLAGESVPAFGSWEARDARFRVIDDVLLRHHFDAAEARMTHAFAAISQNDPHAVIPGGGWGFTVDHLVTHMRQEFALHRWDLIGDDPLGEKLLAQSELLEHSVGLLDQWLLARGLAHDESLHLPFQAWIRCADEPDLMIEVQDGKGRMCFAPAAESAGVLDTDPAARLLLVWGRRPALARRVRSTLAPDSLMRLQTLLSGF